MGLLVAAGYNRIIDVQQEAKQQAITRVGTLDVIQAYKEGAKDVLKLNPIDPRLESTCIQIWGMKQND